MKQVNSRYYRLWVVGTNQHSEPVYNENGDVHTRPSGNSRKAFLRRLRTNAELGNQRALTPVVAVALRQPPMFTVQIDRDVSTSERNRGVVVVPRKSNRCGLT
jgi:hypothetical protein